MAAFEPIYPELAAKHGVLLYPFLLDGVAGEAELNQRDGIHPNAAGVDAMVTGIPPKVEELVIRVRLGSVDRHITVLIGRAKSRHDWHD